VFNFFTTYFSPTQISFLIASFSFTLLASLLHIYKKEKIALILLVTAAACSLIFGALLDPFLNLWDERFHALVAKNMASDFFKPLLYSEELIKIENPDWSYYTIWLHKQPLFLWQIALSFKLFGVSEFTTRLPDIILGSFLVYTNYRCGKILVNKRVGFITSVLTFSSFYLLSLVSGRQMTDHNDFIFMCYVSFSLWALFEYIESNKKIWLFLIGLFSGFAILTKWLVGAMVYLFWFLYKLTNKGQNLGLRNNIDIIKSAGVTLIVFLPWQIFILLKYPQEAKVEYRLNSQHFFKVVEGHDGSFLYHFEQAINIYGLVFIPFILIGFIILFKKITNKPYFFALFLTLIFIYLFFSFAKTKMPSFTIVVSSFVLIAISSFISFVCNLFPKYKKVVFVFSILLVSVYNFNIELLQETHTLWKKENNYTRNMLYHKKFYSQLTLPKNVIIFNEKWHYIEAMFYSENLVYGFMPNEQQYKTLKSKNKTIAIVLNPNENLPKHILNDKNIIILKKQ